MKEGFKQLKEHVGRLATASLLGLGIFAPGSPGVVRSDSATVAGVGCPDQHGQIVNQDGVEIGRAKITWAPSHSEAKADLNPKDTMKINMRHGFGLFNAENVDIWRIWRADFPLNYIDWKGTLSLLFGPDTCLHIKNTSDNTSKLDVIFGTASNARGSLPLPNEPCVTNITGQPILEDPNDTMSYSKKISQQESATFLSQKGLTSIGIVDTSIESNNKTIENEDLREVARIKSENSEATIYRYPGSDDNGGKYPPMEFLSGIQCVTVTALSPKINMIALSRNVNLEVAIPRESIYFPFISNPPARP